MGRVRQSILAIAAVVAAVVCRPAGGQDADAGSEPLERIRVSLPDGRSVELKVPKSTGRGATGWRLRPAGSRPLVLPSGAGVAGVPGAIDPAWPSRPKVGSDQPERRGDATGGDAGGDPLSDDDPGISSFRWTQFTPSADTRVVYVSSSQGQDSNSGLKPEAPVRTIDKAKSLLRHGFPDWMLLKRGDVWDSGLGQWKKSGRSEAEPMVVWSYGDSTVRPTLKGGTGVSVCGGGGSPSSIENVAFAGLNFWCAGRDPDSGEFTGPDAGADGFCWVHPGQNILIEDCVFDSFRGGVVLTGQLDGLKNFRLRGSVVVDCYEVDGKHSQGLYATNVKGLLVEGCVFDHNGWNESVPGAEPTVFNHNLYIDDESDWGTTEDVTVRNNIIAYGASHGLQLRPGGVCDDNLFVGNAIAMFTGAGKSLVRGNVVLDPRDLSPGEERGWGMEVIGSVDALFEGNIVAHKSPDVGDGAAFIVSKSKDVKIPTYKAAFLNNIVFNWNGSMIAATTDQYDSVLVQGNHLQAWDQNGGCVWLSGLPQPPRQITFGSNAYYSANSPSKWFTDAGKSKSYDLPGWIEAVGDAGSAATKESFADPFRTVGTYADTLGAPPTNEGFLSLARGQSRFTWDGRLAARVVNAYIRAGFAKSEEKPGGAPGGVDDLAGEQAGLNK